MADNPNTRQPRAEETRRERRMKPGATTLPGIHLAVDESKLDRDKFVYRFVNDLPGRIQQLKALDYDLATEPAKENSNGIGSEQSTHAGVAEGGRPYNAVLMRKYRDWFENDQKNKQAPLDEMEKAIRGGTDHQQNGNLPLRGSGVYTPNGGNTIESV